MSSAAALDVIGDDAAQDAGVSAETVDVDGSTGAGPTGSLHDKESITLCSDRVEHGRDVIERLQDPGRRTAVDGGHRLGRGGPATTTPTASRDKRP